ncbi:MAG: RNA methyltransferase [Clostridia bacterium]|nr:RNA methyltransferase [Clostridia bacterium]
MKFTENVITGRQNPLVLRAHKLRDKKFRDAEGVFLLDGYKLFLEARQKSATILRIYLSETLADKLPGEVTDIISKEYSDRTVVLSESCFMKISDEKSPQGIIAEIKHLDKWKLFTTIYNEEISSSERILLLDSVQDPGNMGTILRSGAAFGIDRIICGGACADITNSKVLRASMGAALALKVDYVTDTALAIEKLISCGRRVFSAELRSNSIRLSDIDILFSDVFFIGNEGKGIPEHLSRLCSDSVFIPMTDKTESLNAGVAASVCIWTQYSKLL